MMSFKQFSVSMMAVAAVAAAAPAMAATQPFNATNATVVVDSATIAANLQGYTIGTVGSATYNATTGVMTEPVSAVTTATNPGAMMVALDSASGLKFTKSGAPTITLSGFTIDASTGELIGSLKVTQGIFTVLNVQNQSVLKATSFASSLGTDIGTAVTSSTTSRALGVSASNFVLSQSFIDYVATNFDMDATQFGYLANLVQSVNIGTVALPGGSKVPEPSTYALMGLGLVGMSLVARRKQA
ncbi:MAG: hypothetical protein RI907_697 [Pseudomonadota bacterium]|jgi:hypothetical protein